jgi:hypothetical protein
MLILEIALGIAFGIALAPTAYRITAWLLRVGATLRRGTVRVLCHPLTIIFLLLLLNHVLDAILSDRPSRVSFVRSSLERSVALPLQ